MNLGDVTLLPGQIDAHVHLVWNAPAEPHELVAREGSALTALRCAQSAALYLRAGVSSVRDTGATDALSVDVTQAVELGVLPVGIILTVLYAELESDEPSAEREGAQEEGAHDEAREDLAGP